LLFKHELAEALLLGFPISGLPPVALGGSGYRPKNRNQRNFYLFTKMPMAFLPGAPSSGETGFERFFALRHGGKGSFARANPWQTFPAFDSV